MVRIHVGQPIDFYFDFTADEGGQCRLPPAVLGLSPRPSGYFFVTREKSHQHRGRRKVDCKSALRCTVHHHGRTRPGGAPIQGLCRSLPLPSFRTAQLAPQPLVEIFKYLSGWVAEPPKGGGKPHALQDAVVWQATLEVAKRLGLRRLAAALLDDQNPAFLKWNNGSPIQHTRSLSGLQPAKAVTVPKGANTCG